MKIAYIASGAGSMYCGTCLHDNTLAAAILKKGHQVALIPTYTPIRTDEEAVSIDQIFYGGINVYLQQKSAIFRHAPSVIDQLLNSPSLLKLASRFGTTTDPKDLGPLTLSVLQGEEGHQKKELMKLMNWLKDDYKPSIVHLNNSMFVGFARLLKKELNVPVLCSLQGEDLFLEQLAEPYKASALRVLQERAKDVDAFIATSKYYKKFMSGYLNVPDEKIHHVPLGIHLEGHGQSQNQLPDSPFVIGYLARICPEKGLHILVDSFLQLARELTGIKLMVAGYLGARDREYFEEQIKKIHSAKLENSFDYRGELERAQKIEFLNELHVFSMPAPYEDPKGLSLLEALANGVPIVQPNHGAFPEIVESTGGGILVEPNSSDALAQGISQLQTNSTLRKQLGERGKETVHRLFNDSVMADNTLQVFQRYV